MPRLQHFLPFIASVAVLGAAAVAQDAPSGPPPAPAGGAPGPNRDPSAGLPLVRFEARNQNEPWGDRLGPARRIAASIVAAENPSPKSIVDVGSFTGEFLEAFMEQFPNAKGQWTEPVETNRVNAVRRLGGYGNRISYKIGCPARDISLGCVPQGVDVLLTSWLAIHQDLPGIRKFYKEAAAMLPSGGWLVVIDHVAYASPAWEQRLKAARATAKGEELASMTEGPPVHHPGFKDPTLDEQMAAFHDAGLDDVQVVWRRFNTVLMMARKP